MKIDIHELKEIVDKLLEWAIAKYGKTLDISDHFYWNVPASQLYNMEREPTTFDVGQLSDDWLELRKLLSEEREPVRHEFVLLATILHALGEIDVNQTAS